MGRYTVSRVPFLVAAAGTINLMIRKDTGNL